MKKRNRNLVKRALSVCLSLSMCLGMLQITAFAVEGEETSDTTTAVTDTGVKVEVTEKEPSTNEETGVSSEGWTAEGKDEKGVEVTIDSTTTKTPVEGEGEDPNAVKTETKVETTLTDTTDRVEDPTLKGEESWVKDEGPTDLKPEDVEVKVDLSASATVNLGDKASSAEGSSDGNGIADNDLASLLEHDSGLFDCVTSDITYGDKQVNEEDGSISYEAKGKDQDGNSVTVTITIAADGKSYTKTTRTEKTTKGEYVVDKETFENIENPVTTTPTDDSADLPVVSTKVTLEVPEEGDTVERDGVTETVSKVEQKVERDEETGKETIVYTITYTYQVPTVDENGNPVLDEDGNFTFTDMTRTETLSSKDETITTQQKVDEKREDTVTITEVTVKKDIIVGDENGNGTKLNVKVEADKVGYGFGENSKGHAAIYYEDQDGKFTDSDEFKMGGTGIIQNGASDTDDYGSTGQLSDLAGLEEKFNLITINDISKTTVTVRQESTNQADYKADVTIDLAIEPSKLDGSQLKLIVRQGEGENEILKVAYLSKDMVNNNSTGVTVLHDGDKVTGVKFEGIDADKFNLQLVGHQKVTTGFDPINQVETKGYATIDMSTSINVTVSGVTAQLTGTEEIKTGDRTDTTYAHSTKTETVISSSVTSTLYDGTAVVPDDDDNGGGGNDGGGSTTPGDGDTTPPDTDDDDTTTGGGGTTEIGDTDVPLTGGSEETAINDEEVPLAELPEETSIEDDEVPLAELPEEAVIEDDEVPLADVPATGDISAMWYAVTILSACGLMGLHILKKREEA